MELFNKRLEKLKSEDIEELTVVIETRLSEKIKDLSQEDLKKMKEEIERRKNNG